MAGAHHLQTLIANGLAQSAKNPKRNPITLMVPHNGYIQHYVDTEGKIQLIKDGVSTTMVGAVDIEVLPFPMEPTVPDETYAPANHLRFKRLLLNNGPDEDDLEVDDVPPLLENDPALEAKKRGKKPQRLPISDIKVYDLSYFLELNGSFCGQNMLPVKEERVTEIRVPPKVSDLEAVPVTHLAKINTDPIDYLFYAERPRDLIRFFRNIKDRLHPSSVVIIIGNNPGLVEDLYNQVFPNVSKRPNFVDCINKLQMGEYMTQEGFWKSHRSASLLAAQLLIGPLARTIDDGQTQDQVEKRQEEIKCLVDRVLNTPTFGAEITDRKALEEYKLKKLVARSVIYPLTVAFNCMMGEIFSTEERVAEAIALFAEACAVVQSVRPALTHRILLDNLLWAVVRAPNIRPIMLKCVERGYSTNIDLDNGWIIKYGRGNTPMHEKYSQIVKLRARESARAIAADKEEAAKAEARLRVAKEKAARKLERLDTEDIIRKGYKTFRYGGKVEAPLNIPDKTYFKTRSPTEGASIWERVEAPQNKRLEKEDENDSSAHAERSGEDVVEKASELSVNETESRGSGEKASELSVDETEVEKTL